MRIVKTIGKHAEVVGGRMVRDRDKPFRMRLTRP